MAPGNKSHIIVVSDSLTGETYPTHRIYAVSYEPYWQKLRVECSFRTPDEVHAAINKLNEYMVIGGKEDEDGLCKSYRVSNLLNAVPIGQPAPNGGPRIPKQAEDFIVKYRDAVGLIVAKNGKPKTWDWNYTRERLQKMVESEGTEWLSKHLRRLQAQRGNKSRNQSKPELWFYLDLVAEAIK